MKEETLKRIFNFLEEKGEHNAPFKWKFENDIPLTEGDLNVKGDLDLSHTEIESLPEGLKVWGNLSLYYCKHLTSLPKGLNVVGNLDLIASNVEFLSEGLKVGGGLMLQDTNINSLPKGLEVRYNLYIGDSPLIKYSAKKLREMIKPGFIKGDIIR